MTSTLLRTTVISRTSQNAERFEAQLHSRSMAFPYLLLNGIPLACLLYRILRERREKEWDAPDFEIPPNLLPLTLLDYSPDNNPILLYLFSYSLADRKGGIPFSSMDRSRSPF